VRLLVSNDLASPDAALPVLVVVYFRHSTKFCPLGHAPVESLYESFPSTDAIW
jgi:hypothetical protein